MATVVQTDGGRSVTTVGPCAEAKAVFGDVSIIDVPDLGEALVWAQGGHHVPGRR